MLVVHFSKNIFPNFNEYIIEFISLILLDVAACLTEFPGAFTLIINAVKHIASIIPILIAFLSFFIIIMNSTKANIILQTNAVQ